MKKPKTFFVGFVLALLSVMAPTAHALDLTNFAENKLVDALGQKYKIKAVLRTVNGREKPAEVEVEVVAG